MVKDFILDAKNKKEKNLSQEKKNEYILTVKQILCIIISYLFNIGVLTYFAVYKFDLFSFDYTEIKCVISLSLFLF